MAIVRIISVKEFTIVRSINVTEFLTVTRPRVRWILPTQSVGATVFLHAVCSNT